MVRLIMGANGAGKTKQLIDLIHNAVEAENGSVVCMEPSADMTYNISYNVRLVNASEYSVDSFECLRGFISGLYAGTSDLMAVEKFLNWLERFSEKNSVKFTVTITADESLATEGMRNYL